MKKLLALLALVPSLVFSAGSNYPLDKAPDLTNDMAALQRGAKLFSNYCLNCHSAESMRYNRLRDIGLTNEQIKENLMFATENVGDTMTIAMDAKDAKKWFGAAPPDLSLIARPRAPSNGPGADYIHTHLRPYYRDPSNPTGWNTMGFPHVGMPPALWGMRGEGSAAAVAPQGKRRRRFPVRIQRLDLRHAMDTGQAHASRVGPLDDVIPRRVESAVDAIAEVG